MSKQPQPGEFWGVRKIRSPSVRILCWDGDECIVRHRDGRLTTLARVNWQRTDGDWVHMPTCRSFDDTVPSPPDPGDGWRLLTTDEPLTTGDEYYNRTEWRTPAALCPRDSQCPGYFYRRRIELVKPATRTVVLREFVVWAGNGRCFTQWDSAEPTGWTGFHPTGDTLTVEVPE